MLAAAQQLGYSHEILRQPAKIIGDVLGHEVERQTKHHQPGEGAEAEAFHEHVHLRNRAANDGENQIDQWMIPFFGASVYDDPQVYAKSSPITFIKKTKTPTLVLVGDSDGECPTPQSYEFWHALKTLGVETELVVYEHEGHAFSKPEHQRDLIERIAAWFNQHLTGKPQSASKAAE